jgi:hypothetical protein
VELAGAKTNQNKTCIKTTTNSPIFYIVCSKTAMMEALFQLDECMVVQKYCEKCLNKAEYELPPH